MPYKKPVTPKPKPPPPANFFDTMHAEKICDIPQTTPFKYVDPMVRMRPTNRMVRKFELHQTFAVMDKGPVKMRFTDTFGDFDTFPEGDEPPWTPPLFPVQRPEHGRGPLSVLLEELWALVIQKQQDRTQLINRERYLEVRRKAKTKLQQGHKRILKFIGPDWYQELSNSQRHLAEDLAHCISLDLKTNSIDNTRENLARFGLVPRANPCLIQRALRECCSCPIEFLLILYQYTNPSRSSYSINDRMILSAVVHLTMADTLREMHIRIPSPPPKPKRIRRKCCCKHLPKCKSPYQHPLPVVKPPDKSHLYGKPDREYPTNTYFWYLPELKANKIMLDMEDEDLTDNKNCMEGQRGSRAEIIPEKFNTDPNVVPEQDKKFDILTWMEDDIIRDWIVAQRAYSSISKCSKVPALHKASFFIPCLNRFLQMQEETTPNPTVPSKSENPDCCTLERPSYQNPTSCCTSERTSCPKPTTSCCMSQPPCPPKPTPPCCTLERPSYPKPTPPCCKLPAQTNNNKPPCTTILPPKTKSSTDTCTCQPPETLESEESTTPECTCRQKIMQKIAENEQRLCQCDLCVQDRYKAAHKQTMIITNIRDDENSTKIIGGILSKARCNCMERYKKRWDRYEKKMELLKTQLEIVKQKTKYIIGGTFVAPDGKIGYIISGTEPQTECPCAHFDETQKQQEHEMEMRATVPPTCKPLVLGGVQARPDGNVFIVSGIMPSPECACQEMFDAFEKQHDYCMSLYEEFLKKIEFDSENYFKEMSADYAEFQPNDDWDEVIVDSEVCSCIKPPICIESDWKLPELVLQPIPSHEQPLCCNRPDCRANTRDARCTFPSSSSSESSGTDTDPSCPGCAKPPTKPAICSGCCVKPLVSCVEPPQSCVKPPPSCVKPSPSCVKPSPSCVKPSQSCVEPPPTSVKPPACCVKPPQGGLTKPAQGGGLIKPPQDGGLTKPPPCCEKRLMSCMDDSSFSSQPTTTSSSPCSCIQGSTCESETPPTCCESDDSTSCQCCMCKSQECEDLPDIQSEESKRYIILDKIPCDEGTQVKLIKRVLASLAKDGYPLAMLPDVYRLPHFKLWMVMRCGGYYTLQDKFDMMIRGRCNWRHVDLCRRTPQLPNDSFLKDTPGKHNWRFNPTIRTGGGAISSHYYGALACTSMEYAREFFATTLSYQFPTKSFRDVFFAYLPPKMEAVTPFKMWLSREWRDHTRNKNKC